jgi:hypothetical protein
MSHPMNLRYAYIITLESGGISYSKKIAYFISKIPIPRNERKQTEPKRKMTPTKKKVEDTGEGKKEKRKIHSLVTKKIDTL